MTAALRAPLGPVVRPVVGLGRSAAAFSARHRRVVTIVLAALLAVGIAAVVVLAVLLQRATATERAETAGLEAASRAAGQLLSYRPADLDSAAARSRELVAPEYAAEYDRLVNELIGPAVRQNQLDTTATVQRAGVLEAGPGRADVLVFLKQVTQTPGAAETPTSSRAVVSVVEQDGRWLVSGLRPV